MIEIANVSFPLDTDFSHIRLARLSVDARKKSDVHFVATVLEDAPEGMTDEEYVAALCQQGKSAKVHHEYIPLFETCGVSRVGNGTHEEDSSRGNDITGSCPLRGDNDIFELHTLQDDEEAEVLVVGSGPAGLFCALTLARAGIKPLLIERGGCVDERVCAVEHFEQTGELDLKTNVQFGEGGAGTFSDGKLNSGVKSWLTPHVLQWFVDAGAPEDIKVWAKPHIGTDYLRQVVVTMCKQIESAGGRVVFHAQLVDIETDDVAPQEDVDAHKENVLRDFKSKRVIAAMVEIETGEIIRLKTNHIVLAIGHSARDTFEMLNQNHIVMEQKPFSIGVRIEHPQKLVNAAQYGSAADNPYLPPADYKMAVHLPSGRSVYTFCMCPGGQVVCAASEEDGVVVNGMSYHARDGVNANSALLVGVGPEDFSSTDPLAGVAFQREIEQRAFHCAQDVFARLASENTSVSCNANESASVSNEANGNYCAPAQTVQSFIKGKVDTPERFSASSSKKPHPTYARGVVPCDLNEVLPDFVAQSLKESLPLFDKKLHGFASPDAVLTGVETRSSSPVRIKRDDTYQSNVSGLYPSGEGAGYAGGIMSSAIDGMKVALGIVREKQLSHAVRVLREGKPAVFATDTVYGVGVSPLYAPSPEPLFEVKGRPSDKPIAWLVDSPDALERYGVDVPECAFAWAKEFWPGALTIIVKASDAVPAAFLSGAKTIGLRMPDSDVALELMQRMKSPLCTTSANISGQPAVAYSSQISSELRSRVEACVWDDSPKSGCASTVVDVSGKEPIILRQGDVVLY